MAKSQRSFLIAWTKQAAEACDEGLEEAYRAAEVIAALLDLIEPEADDEPEDPDCLPDGSRLDEVGDAHLEDGPRDGEASRGLAQGREGTQPGVSGLVRPAHRDGQQLHSAGPSVRRTGSDHAAGMIPPDRKLMKRRV